MSESRLFSMLASLVLCAAAAPAQGDALVTVNSADGLLRIVDPGTASTLSSIPITTSNGRNASFCNGLARDPVSGALFVIVNEQNAAGRKLAVLDPATGIATIAGVLADNFAGLAFRADGTLFGVTGDGAATPETLWTLNPANAQATQVIPLGNGNDGETIGFGSDGFLYHASGFGVQNVDEIFERIDTSNNVVTPLTLSGFDYDEMMSMVVYAGDNMLASDLNDDLFALTTGGHTTLIGTLDHGPVKGMAIVPTANNLAFFRAYGNGCPTSSGSISLFTGSGTPNPGAVVHLHLLHAPAASFGALVLGTGNGAIPVPSATCQAQINPIAPGSAGFVTSAAGSFNFTLSLPAGLSPSDFFLQTAIVDTSAFVVSNPLQLHVR